MSTLHLLPTPARTAPAGRAPVRPKPIPNRALDFWLALLAVVVFYAALVYAGFQLFAGTQPPLADPLFWVIMAALVVVCLILPLCMAVAAGRADRLAKHDPYS